MEKRLGDIRQVNSDKDSRKEVRSFRKVLSHRLSPQFQEPRIDGGRHARRRQGAPSESSLV